jgi:hypothetical protein
MVATLTERELAGLRWTVVRGPRDEAFRLLGEHAAADIAAVLDELPGRARLAALARRDPDLYQAIRAATAARHPDGWAELHELARGAGVPFDDLLLINLRGDLGVGDGTGCTDLAWGGEHALIGHNEDGAPVFDGRSRLLTLLISGEPGVCVWWYPGFLPANTFAVTARGMVWGIDHVGVVKPGPGAGRHFVARAMQRVDSVRAAVAHLRAHPSAGGFAYTIGQVGRPGVTVVETAGAQTAAVPVTHGFSWHTNHLRRLSHLDIADEESLARALVCARLEPEQPDAAWILDALNGSLRRDATGGDPLLTLSTMVADLAGGVVTILPRSGSPLRATVRELASGAVPAAARR